jgi:threonine dehydratase
VRSRARADTRAAGSGSLRLEDVEAAARSIAGRIVRTPVLRAPWADSTTDTTIYLKAELLQHTGSFKVRGVLSRLARATDDERKRGVVAVSAGNHAQALAYGCRAEGIACTVVMWGSASAAKKQSTRVLGATVDDSPRGPAEAFERMEEIRAETNSVLIHPFADPWVIAGQGSVGLELVRDVAGLDAVVVPVGGGGLICGIAAALRSGGDGPRVIGVEPREAAALAAGVAAGVPVAIEPRSVADGLMAPFTTQICIDLVKTLGIELVTVDESAIRAAMRRLYVDAKLACEPAGATALGALEAGTIAGLAGKKVVAIVSGGNVDALVATDILSQE